MHAIGIIIVLLLTALVGVLLSGIILMGIGGKTNEKYGNKLMVARVWLQGLVLLMIVLLFFASGKT